MENVEQVQELAKYWEPVISILMVGLMQAVKTALPNMPLRIVPLLLIVGGIGLMAALSGLTVESVIAGAMIGLASSGIWSSSKTIVNGPGNGG